MMKREAIELHGVPADRVVVTGAQPFDHWFTWQPATGRDAFCQRVQLPPDQPYLLYLCSSRFVAPDEARFVRRWIEQLRQAGSPALQRAGVLIRPHPQNAGQWRDANLRDLGPVAVWPPGGAAPSDDITRADYFDSIYHSAAVVGVNTTAEIESAIIGRRVYTVLAPEFRDTQEGTLHFHHLRDVNGGLLHVATTPAEHLEQLDAALRDPGVGDERCRRFVNAFVRPFGLDVAATPKLVATLERAAKAPAPPPVRPPLWARLAQPALARRGERQLRELLRAHELKAIRAAARARRSQPIAVPAAEPGPVQAADALSWRRVAAAFRALDYRDRIRFGKDTLSELPGELLQQRITRERLDYPGADVYLRVTTKAERHRLRACAKEPFTIEWLERHVGAGEVLYDIGANVGVYSLVAALKPAGARVYAFEPSYPNVASLCANIVLNDATGRITPLPLALSNETGLRTFGLRSLDAGTARHALGEAPAGEGATLYRQPVLAYRLDDAVARLQLPLPNHIKLDVDGGELAVLEGAAATLASPSLRSMLVEVSTSLSVEVTEAICRLGLRLDRRIDVRNREGESLIWYGLFTRAPQGVTGPPPASAVVTASP
jgi:FkbM family methyltransferase